MLIDTHAHLNFPDFNLDIDKVIEESVENGVTKIICASSNLEDSKRSIEIAKKFPGIVFASVGIHPQKTCLPPACRQGRAGRPISDSINLQLDQLAKLAKSPEVVAIGECGLDYSDAPPNEENRSKEEQEVLFKGQVEIAQKLNLPLIIHSRKALDAVYQTLVSYNSICYQGVFHCYSGGKSDIKKIEGLGFYFGLDGNLTYDLGLQNVVKEIPLEKIILETDSPFLTPEPLRGQRNSPSNIKLIAEFLAKLMDYQYNEISNITTENAKKLFKLE